MRLEPGQVAVITGAASGIGLALATAFTERGLNVAMTDVETQALEIEVSALRAKGAQVAGFTCDVSSWPDVTQMKDAVLSHFGRIDVVCNNAGVVVPFGPLWAVEPTDWEWILDVNLRGVFNGIRAFAPLLVAQGWGHIVNTASMAGVSRIPGNGAYNATKHAVVSLTETLHGDFSAAHSEVGATALCCGLVQTRIHDAARNKPHSTPNTSTAPLISMAAMPATYLEPMEVALQVLEAIETSRLYLFTNSGSRARIVERIERLLQDLP